MTKTRALLFCALALGACGDGNTAVPGQCGPGAVDVENEGWSHVQEGAAITWRHNPPASGPHYPVWARYAIHDKVVARGYWVHNLEHGAVVLLYRPDAQADAIAALKQAYAGLPDDPSCGTAGAKRALLTPDPLLPTPVAAVAANAVLAGDLLTTEQIRDFATRCRAKGPEDVCADGSYSPP